MKKTIGIILAAVVILIGTPAFANELKIGSLGARASAMGGAFVGLADDFSAFFWNPAGLGFMNKRALSFDALDLIPSASYRQTAGSVDLVNAEAPTKHYLGGLGGYIQPIDDRLVVGLGIFTTAGFGAAWDAEDMAYYSGGRADIDWSTRVGIYTFAPTLAYKINDSFSVGVQLHIHYGYFNMNTYAGQLSMAPNPVVDLGLYEESLSGWGLGASIGAIFKPNETLSFGLTYRTASTVKFSGDAAISTLSYLGYAGISEMERPVTWPSDLAFGLAVKPADGLTVTADVRYTNWKSVGVLDSTYTDPFWATLMALSGKNRMDLSWKSRLQVRAGVEYRFKPDWAVRAGYSHNPAPGPDTSMNVLLPNFTFNGLTFGFGRMVGEIQIDFGLELMFGAKRTIDLVQIMTFPPPTSAMPGTYSTTILVPHLSVSHRF
jgi:long-chain fatty acid transport protein